MGSVGQGPFEEPAPQTGPLWPHAREVHTTETSPQTRAKVPLVLYLGHVLGPQEGEHTLLRDDEKTGVSLLPTG